MLNFQGTGTLLQPWKRSGRVLVTLYRPLQFQYVNRTVKFRALLSMYSQNQRSVAISMTGNTFTCKKTKLSKIRQQHLCQEYEKMYLLCLYPPASGVRRTQKLRTPQVGVQGWVARPRPRPNLRQGCTCWVANWPPWRLKLKLSLSQKAGCTTEVVTQSGTSMRIWAELH